MNVNDSANPTCLHKKVEFAQKNMVIIQRNDQYESGKEIYIPLLIDLLISNNFSSMTFFCATRILQVIGRQSIV